MLAIPMTLPCRHTSDNFFLLLIPVEQWPRNAGTITAKNWHYGVRTAHNSYNSARIGTMCIVQNWPRWSARLRSSILFLPRQGHRSFLKISSHPLARKSTTLRYIMDILSVYVLSSAIYSISLRRARDSSSTLAANLATLLRCLQIGYQWQRQ